MHTQWFDKSICNINIYMNIYIPMYEYIYIPIYEYIYIPIYEYIYIPIYEYTYIPIYEYIYTYINKKKAKYLENDFIVDKLFARVKHFSFNIKPTSRQYLHVKLYLLTYMQFKKKMKCSKISNSHFTWYIRIIYKYNICIYYIFEYI